MRKRMLLGIAVLLTLAALGVALKLGLPRKSSSPAGDSAHHATLPIAKPSSPPGEGLIGDRYAVSSEFDGFFDFGKGEIESEAGMDGPGEFDGEPDENETDPFGTALPQNAAQKGLPPGTELYLAIHHHEDLDKLAALPPAAVKGLALVTLHLEFPTSATIRRSPTPSQVRAITRLKGLDTLMLGVEFQSAEMMDMLASLPELRRLELDCAETPPGRFSAVAKLARLDSLALYNLNENNIEAALGAADALKGLKRLLLGCHGWRDEHGYDAIPEFDRSLISRLPPLKSLTLKGCMASDAILSSLQGQEYLERLYLMPPAIAACGRHVTILSRLPFLPYLQELRLDGDDLTSDGVADQFNGLVNLKRLHLSSTYLNERMLRSICTLRSLEEFVFNGAFLLNSDQQESEEPFGRLPALRTLRMEFNLIPSHPALGWLESLPNLTELDLRSLSTEPGEYSHLGRLSNLEKLALDGDEFGPELSAHLAPLKNLKSLNLPNAGMSEADVEDLRNLLPKCEMKIGGRDTLPAKSP